jgi:hypothetical protein
MWYSENICKYYKEKTPWLCRKGFIVIKARVPEKEGAVSIQALPYSI